MQEVQVAANRCPSLAVSEDVLASWKALQQLPSKQASALQCVSRRLATAKADKQEGQGSLLDAQADLQDCLSEVQAEDGNIAGAVKACLLTAVQDLKVGCDMKPFCCICALGDTSFAMYHCVNVSMYHVW